MTDDTIMDSFNNAVGRVYEQDKLDFFRAAVEDVNTSFIENFKKAPDAETREELVVAFAVFIAGQANTVPEKAGYSLAIGDTVETLCKTLTDTVVDRSLIPQDFMIFLLEGVEKINNQWGGKQYEDAKHITVEKIITAAQQFRPATLVRPEGYTPPAPPPAPVEKPAAPKPAQPDIYSLLKKL